MPTRIITDWKYRDMQAVILENEFLRIIILPELGAKLWQITYKPKDFDFLWQHPRLKPSRVPKNAVYDDHFFGGWDELFPNDIPEILAGEQMPDHGELWTMSWNYEVGGDTVHLWAETDASCCRLDKWITLREGEAQIRFHHKITNLGQKDLPYLWKLHAAMRIDEHATVNMGARNVFIDEFGPTRIRRGGFTYRWPSAEGHDMRRIPPRTAMVNEFQFATEMDAGWCAVTHSNDRVGFGLLFDLAVFPSCWTFASYGNWRNVNTLIMEPCTGYPISVQEGVSQGTHKVLRAGESIETTVLGIAYDGCREVHHIDAEGRVEGID